MYGIYVKWHQVPKMDARSSISVAKSELHAEHYQFVG